MNPEEKFIKDVWYVLQEIQRKSLYTKKGSPVKYELDPNAITEYSLGSEEKESVLYKLQEWRAIEIVNDGSEYVNEYYGGPHYKVISLWKSSEFNKYYNSFKKSLEKDNQKEVTNNELSQEIQELRPIQGLPVGTKWKDINIKWINGNDVEITLKNDKSYKEIYDFKELGFYDKKRKCPNLDWKTLQGLASNDNKMSWHSIKGITEVEIMRKVEAFQKRKSNLSKHLMKIFDIKNDPFHVFPKEKEYIIKINLIPEKRSRKDKKEENWRNLLSEHEIEKWETETKEDYISNPNQEKYENDKN